MTGPYRQGDRLGRALSTHRTYALSWLAAAALGVGGAGLATRFLHGPSALRAGVALLVMSGLAVWCATEWWRLTRVRVVCHERGFVSFDGTGRHEATWDEVTAVEAEYVPGALGRGAADEGNLVGLTLRVRTGVVTVPRELAGFRALVAIFRARIQVPWQRAVIANLIHRS